MKRDKLARDGTKMSKPLYIILSLYERQKRFLNEGKMSAIGGQ